MAFKENAPDAGETKQTGLTFRGKEIILAPSRGKYQRQGLVKKGIEKGIYPDNMKVEAATIYAASGSLQTASDMSKVPLPKLREWRKTDWFQNLLREVWTENNEKIDAKFTAIIEKSLTNLEDRLEHGDFHVLKDGNLIRRPVSAKDLSLVSAINVDKRQLLRGLPTSRSETLGEASSKTVEKLEQLATTFENLARFGRQPKTIEMEVVSDANVETTETSNEGQESPQEVIVNAIQS